VISRGAGDRGRAARAILVATLSISFGAGCASAQPAASASRPTPPDALLSPERIAQLPPAVRAAWADYLERSRRLHADDRAFMEAELRALGRTTMRRAPYGRGFDLTPAMTDAWFRSDSARALGESLLTWQTPAGGWSKRTDFSRPRERGESWYAESDGWHYIGTIDNGATTAQLRFLATLATARGDGTAPFRRGYERGVRYLLAAQMPNGCWPQVFPLQGGYADAVTFNDDAIVNVLETLRDAAAGASRMLPDSLRRAAAAAVERGHECLLATQVVRDGVKTVWGQQHDPLTLAVTKARSYELAGLSGKESAGILTYLLTVPSPDARVVAAIEAAAAYFERTKILGYEYGADFVLRAKEGAGPIWARLRELETDRPIFANRDGGTLYDWNQLTDRRTGYAWFSTDPASALQKYAKWRRTHGRDASR